MSDKGDPINFKANEEDDHECVFSNPTYQDAKDFDT